MAQHFYLAEPACAHHVYVGAADTDGNTAIFRCSFAGGVLTRDDADDAAAAWAPAAVREGDKGAGWISAAPSGDSLYVSVRGGPEPEQHYVAHYAIDRKDGALTEASTQQTVLLGSPHCSVDPSGRMLVSSQMKGGGVTSFPLAADGALQPAATVLPLEGGGSGANPKRSTQHFCHSAQMAVGGSHVFVPDLGADKLWSFALHPESGTMSPATPADHWVAPPGSGPRHLACHPNGEWVFLITEMGCTIEPLLYSAATGSLERLAPSVSTLPPDWAGTMSVAVGDSLGCTTADVHCSPDGK
jgi:6-phosphogluconolactonase